MTNLPSPTGPLPSLNEHLYAKGKIDDGLRHLILAIARAAAYIQYAIRTTEAGLAGSKNTFGEEQVKLDVLSNAIVSKSLRESRLVAAYASEEEEHVVELAKKAPYCVVFDPLDGSSLVDVNFAIGTIVGIYPGGEILGRKGSHLIAALYVLYGPRTILTYSTGESVHSFLLNDVGEFVLLREYLGIADTGKTFSPGNIGAAADHKGYEKLLTSWIKAGSTLRYSGCMVADIHHVLQKGQGIFVNVGGRSHPKGKLRLAYECGPMAYLLHHAGGNAKDGERDILDLSLGSLDQRTPIIAGSKAMVEEACAMLGG